MAEHQILAIFVQRAIDQLTLYAAIQSGNSRSDYLKWRKTIHFVLVRTLVDIAETKTVSSLLNFLKNMEAEDEMEQAEQILQRRLFVTAENCEKELSSKSNRDEDLLRLISTLKDKVNQQIEQSARTLDFCVQHERELVKRLNSDFYTNDLMLAQEIAALEQALVNEGCRSNDVEFRLCSDIEKIQNNTVDLKRNWEKAIDVITRELQELIQQRGILSPIIKDEHDKLIARKAVVDEERQKKLLEEQQRIEFVKRWMAVVKLQAWWRGVLARKDYARFKLMMKTGKGKAKGPVSKIPIGHNNNKIPKGREKPKHR